MGCKILKWIRWPWPCPFQGRFRVGLPMVNQYIKFEVSRCTHYKAMNGSAKCRKWGGLGWLEGTQGHQQCHHFIESIHDLSVNFNRNYASVLYCFWDIASYLSKVAAFNPPHQYLVPPSGVTPVEFCRDLWQQKTRVPKLLCGIYPFQSISTCDRQTHGHSTYHTSIAPHSKNYNINNFFYSFYHETAKLLIQLHKITAVMVQAKSRLWFLVIWLLKLTKYASWCNTQKKLTR